MKKKLIIIKLGGSVITDKTSTKPTPRLDIIKKLAKQIASISHSNKYQLVLVHGAGSFGHPLAKRFDLQNGMKSRLQRLGLAITQQKMLELNFLITSSLTDFEVPAVSFPPHSFIIQNDRKFLEFDYRIIKQGLALNLTPVLFGDVVLDDKLGCSIISGDAIVSYIAKTLKADRVIFLSDVDGIFDKDPKKYDDAKLIPLINNANFEHVLKGLERSGRDDVTDEMEGKIKEIKSKLSGMDVHIISGLSPRATIPVEELNQYGTTIRFE